MIVGVINPGSFCLGQTLRGCLARAVCGLKMRFGPKTHFQLMVVFGSLLVENAFWEIVN